MKQKVYQGMTFVPYIENPAIMERVDDIAGKISERYKDKKPLVVCVLNGAFPFAADLFRRLDIDAEITFIRLKSYEGTSSTGVVREVLGLGADIKGRDIILVEDIVDTGHTIVNLVEKVKALEPASIAVATLLFKPEALLHDFTPDYVGFNIPKKFIIGYGLDIDGLARNLPDIYVVKE
ncbi:MAG: hypoxanthine phosphoribosyltransferase [Duncaniella sp.]|nr:hypoxanthine phosphoribosyltransferase [Duncaniella sp.]